jgi:hypothetical protein
MFIFVSYSYIVYIIAILFHALLIINKTTNSLTFVSCSFRRASIRLLEGAKAGLFGTFRSTLSDKVPSADPQILLCQRVLGSNQGQLRLWHW